MEILTNYSNNILELINDNDSKYNLNSFKDYINEEPSIDYHEIMLSVFDQNNIFISSFVLNQSSGDFYIKNDQIYLKPNNVLDRENFSEGNYNLQFDFLKRDITSPEVLLIMMLYYLKKWPFLLSQSYFPIYYYLF